MKYVYPFTYKQLIKCMIYFILTSSIFILQLNAPKDNRVYFQFYGYMLLICIFTFRYFIFKRRIKDKTYISLNAVRCLNMFEKCLIVFGGIIVIGSVLVLKYRNIWDEYLLFWQYAVLFIIGCIGIYYPFIVIFGEKSYISGSFGMKYDEIKEITEIKKYNIMGTELIKCRIETKNGKNCTEKFTIEEFDFLRSACINRE